MSSLEMSVITRVTRRHISKDGILQVRKCLGTSQTWTQFVITAWYMLICGSFKSSIISNCLSPQNTHTKAQMHLAPLQSDYICDNSSPCQKSLTIPCCFRKHTAELNPFCLLGYFSLGKFIKQLLGHAVAQSVSRQPVSWSSCQDSILVQTMWDMWKRKWICSTCFGSLAHSHSISCFHNSPYSYDPPLLSASVSQRSEANSLQVHIKNVSKRCLY
jgi:hypothetical protein